MTTLLAIGAHPDDETMFAGGTFAWLARRGVAVRILGVTRGEGGEVGEPPVSTQDRLGETREAELRRAAATFGAAGVDFLPFVDPLLTHTGSDPAPSSALFRIAADEETFEAAVVERIRAIQPDILLTHGSDGEYGHPQHLYTHETVRRAFLSAGDPAHFPAAGTPHAPAALYTWAAYYPTNGSERLERLLNQADPADWLIDLTDDLLDIKEAAARCHASQLALFTRRAESGGVRELMLRRESFHRAALRPGLTTDPLADLLATAPIATRADPATPPPGEAQEQ